MGLPLTVSCTLIKVPFSWTLILTYCLPSHSGGRSLYRLMFHDCLGKFTSILSHSYPLKSKSWTTEGFFVVSLSFP